MTAEQIWQQFNTELLNYIRSRVANTEDARDIHANIFLKLAQLGHKLQDIDNVRAWVYRIARNSITDYYRATRHNLDLPDDASVPEVDIVDKLSDEQLRSCLHKLINYLPPRYQAALIATQLDGLPDKDYARAQGISLPKAKGLIRRARIKLQNIADSCLNGTEVYACNCLEF